LTLQKVYAKIDTSAVRLFLAVLRIGSGLTLSVHLKSTSDIKNPHIP